MITACSLPSLSLRLLASTLVDFDLGLARSRLLSFARFISSHSLTLSISFIVTLCRAVAVVLLKILLQFEVNIS